MTNAIATKTARAPKTVTLPKDKNTEILKSIVAPVADVVYNGTPMTRERAMELHEIERGHAHRTAGFDLLCVLDDLLVTPALKSRVFSSMAWSIDMAVINAARSVFWDTLSEATEHGHIDNFAEFLNKMSEIKANESYVGELGFELNSGRLAQISLLMKLSKNWHDKAQTVALSARLRYTPKSFEVLLASEKEQPVTALSREKLRMLVEALYEGEDVTDDERAQAEEMLIKKAESDNASRHEARQKITPAVLRILDYVSHHVYGENVTEFWQLPFNTQGRFIDTSVKTIDRAMSDLGQDRRISPMEFMGMIKEHKAALKSLKAEAAKPEYAVE